MSGVYFPPMNPQQGVFPQGAVGAAAAAPGPMQQVHPFQVLLTSLVAKFELPADLYQAGHVVLVAVPGGLSLRLSAVGLVVGEMVGVHFGLEKEDVSYGQFVQQIRIPLDRLPHVLAYCGLPAEFRNNIRNGSTVFTNYQIHTSINQADNQIRPLHTLGLTLAHLDPQQHQLLQHFVNPRSRPEEEQGLKIPFIRSVDKGLQIWFPENSSPDFIELVGNIFMLTPRNGTYEGTHGRYHKVIEIDRDDVRTFLVRVGLDDFVNVGGRASVNENVTLYMNILTTMGAFHPYQPVILPEDLIGSFALSLHALLPSDEETIPLVVIHPTLGILIRLTADGRLVDFLGFGSRPVTCTVNGVTYHQEVVIPFDKISSSLRRPMRLEMIENQLMTLVESRREVIRDLWGKKKRFIGSRAVIEPRIANTISRRLSAVMGPNQAANLRESGRQENPEFDTPEQWLPLPRLECTYHMLTIYFPARPLENRGIGKLVFDYLDGHTPEDPRDRAEVAEIAGFLGLNAEKCNRNFPGDPRTYNYRINVPYSPYWKKNRILQLLERDLGLQDLPPDSIVPYDGSPGSGRLTCWDEMVFGFFNQLGILFTPHGSVMKEGIRLIPARLETPDQLPNYSEREILESIRAVLAGGGLSVPQQVAYLGIFNDFLIGLRGGNQMITSVGNAIRHFVFELNGNPPKVSQQVKKNSVLSLLTGTAHSLEGMQLLLEKETKRVRGEQVDITDLILTIVAVWKNDNLATLFLGLAQSVSAIAAAQVAWGEEFGLDVQAGLRDPHIEFGYPLLTEERLRIFRDRCNDAQRLLDGITTCINERVDENGALIDLPQLREKAEYYLKERGFDTAARGRKMDEFFPVNGGNYTVRLSRAGVKALLVDAGIVSP